MPTVKSYSNLLYEKSISQSISIAKLLCCFVSGITAPKRAKYGNVFSMLESPLFKLHITFKTIMSHVLGMRWHTALCSFIYSGRWQMVWAIVISFLYASSKSLGYYTSKHNFSSFILMGSKKFGIFSFRTDTIILWPFSAC